MISFDFVSPEKLLFKDEVGMIIVPGKDGDIGVLARSQQTYYLLCGQVVLWCTVKIEQLLQVFFCFRWVC